MTGACASRVEGPGGRGARALRLVLLPGVLLACLALANACGPDSPGPAADGGVFPADAAIDAGIDFDAGGDIDAGGTADAGLDTDAGDVIDAGVADAGPESDAGVDAGGDLDAGAPDAGADAGGAADAGTFDAGPVDAGPGDGLPGFGRITGPCELLDTEITDYSTPYLFENHIDFGTDAYDDGDLPRLTPGGQVIVQEENAGGSSVLSETFAFEMLARCESAALLKTEMQIVYTNPSGKLTDILVDIDGRKVGVSVTRAVSYPRTATYTTAQAKSLLDKKLQGILDSTANVTPADRWVKQILYVLAWSPAHASAMAAAWAAEPDALRADTIVIVTVTDGDDEFIYSGG